MDQDRKTILVIDDEEDFSFFTQKNLERIDGYNVVTASSGNEGIEIACRIKPDIILLDIMMPGISGFEVLQMLKTNKETSSIPVLMLTGKDDERSREHAARLQNDDYLIKPIEVEQLRSRIEKVLRG